MSRILVLLLACAPLAGCWRYDPLYCDSQEDCADNPGLTFCDLNGEYEASEHIARTCIPQPPAPAIAISVTAARTFIRAGGSATIDFTVSLNAPADAPIEVTASDLPDGVTTSPVSLTPDAMTGRLDVSATDGAKLGEAIARLTARSGNISATTDTHLDIIGVPGTLDPTFGANGVVLTGLNGGTVAGFLQGDKVVVIGSQGVVRLHDNGSIDEAFGENGKATLPADVLTMMNLTITAAVQTRNGGILVGGTGQNRDHEDDVNAFIAYFTSQGQFDPARPPRTLQDRREFRSQVMRLAVANNDDVLAMIEHQPVAPGSVVREIVRVDVAGRLVTDFGTDGVLATDARGNCGLFVLQDDKIIDCSSSLRRLSPRGQVDSSFGQAGSTSLGFMGGASFAGLAADGQFILAGSVGADPAEMMTVARIGRDGNVDTSFGRSGVATFPMSTEFSEQAFFAWSSSDGAIYGVGYNYEFAPYVRRLRFLRLRGDGSPDDAFGANGVRSDTFAWYRPEVAIPTDRHRLLVVGSDPENSIGVRVHRYWY